MENKKSSKSLLADTFIACSVCNFLNDKEVVFCKNCGTPLAPPPKTLRWKLATFAKNAIPITALVSIIGLFARLPSIVFLSSGVSAISAVLYLIFRKSLVFSPEALKQAKDSSLQAKEQHINELLKQQNERAEHIQKALETVRALNDSQALQLAEITSEKALQAIEREKLILQTKTLEIAALRVISVLAYNNADASLASSSSLDAADKVLNVVPMILDAHQKLHLSSSESASLRTYQEIIQSALRALQQSNARRALDELANSVKDISAIEQISTTSDSSSVQNMEALFQTMLLRFDSEFSALTKAHDKLDAQKEL